MTPSTWSCSLELVFPDPGLAVMLPPGRTVTWLLKPDSTDPELFPDGGLRHFPWPCLQLDASGRPGRLLPLGRPPSLLSVPVARTIEPCVPLAVVWVCFVVLLFGQINSKLSLFSSLTCEAELSTRGSSRIVWSASRSVRVVAHTPLESRTFPVFSLPICFLKLVDFVRAV